MIIFFAAALATALFGIKLQKKSGFFHDYISKEQSQGINGLFALLIFISHVSTYIRLSGGADTAYSFVKSYLGQLVVVSFMFYSGFGIAEQIKSRGMPYVKGFFCNRFLKVFYHSALAILLYLGANAAIGKRYPLKTVLLAFIGYRGIGNSSWYIFAIFGLYLIVFVSFIICRANRPVGTVIATALSLAFVVFQIKGGRESWSYNTIMLFPVGMWYSLVREYIEKAVMKNNLSWLGSLAFCFGLFALFSFRRGGGLAFYSLWAIFFMLCIVLFTMKVKLQNKALLWLGSHAFSLFILQRLPMLLLSHIGFTSYKYLFVAVCFVLTLALSFAFDLLLQKTDSLIYKRRTTK